MAKPKPRTTPASRARTQVRAQARDTMRQRAANTGAKPRLAAGVKPGTPIATGKGPLQKNTMSGKPKSGGRIAPPSPPKPPKGPGKGPQLPLFPRTQFGERQILSVLRVVAVSTQRSIVFPHKQLSPQQGQCHVAPK